MKHATIFVVDDESDSLDALIHALQAAGFKALVESSGKRALRQLERTQPELLLLEVLMPDMDSFETSRLGKMVREAKDEAGIEEIISQTGDDLTNLGLREALEAFEKRYIMRMLARNNGHRRKTAKMLGLPIRTFQRKIKKFGLI